MLQTLIRFFLPDESRFFDYILSVAETASQAAVLFRDLERAEGRDAQLALVDRIKEAERAGDAALKTMSEALDATFVTPIDREDLYHLASALEIVSDFISATANHLLIHKLDRLPAGSQELGEILVAATQRCVDATRHLRFGQTDKIREACGALMALEHDADTAFRIRLGELFNNCKDPIELIKAKAFLEGLEDAVDRCADVATVLEAVLIKNG
jgi:uncharacterized protein Yka (UPF0111/DUF47 family)